MDQGLVFRPGTLDEAIFRGVVHGNEYRIPERLRPDDLVIDIGAHVGGFSYLMLTRGARRVYSFEVEPGNFAVCDRNLAPFGDRSVRESKAVWRSDVPPARLGYSYSNDPSNTGGGGVLWGDASSSFETIALDEIIARVQEETGCSRIAWLKTDCECAEFPILLTSKSLACVDRIVGEFHELASPRMPSPIPETSRIPGVDSFSIEVLKSHLEGLGFQFEFVYHGASHMGLFWATHREARPCLRNPSAPARWLRAAWTRLRGQRTQRSAAA